MSGDGWVSAWKALPLIGHVYELRRYGEVIATAKVVEARQVQRGQRVELTLEDGKVISTALDLEWRLAPVDL